MLRVAALLLVQLRVAVCPGPILLGEATRVTPRIFTVAEADAVTPCAPVAVAVYVVVAGTTTAAEPESATEVTSSPRMDGVIATDVEFVLAHVKVVVWPAATTFGERVKVIDGAEP